MRYFYNKLNVLYYILIVANIESIYYGETESRDNIVASSKITQDFRLKQKL